MLWLTAVTLLCVAGTGVALYLLGGFVSISFLRARMLQEPRSGSGWTASESFPGFVFAWVLALVGGGQAPLDQTSATEVGTAENTLDLPSPNVLTAEPEPFV